MTFGPVLEILNPVNVVLPACKMSVVINVQAAKLANIQYIGIL